MSRLMDLMDIWLGIPQLSDETVDAFPIRAEESNIQPFIPYVPEVKVKKKKLPCFTQPYWFQLNKIRNKKKENHDSVNYYLMIKAERESEKTELVKLEGINWDLVYKRKDDKYVPNQLTGPRTGWFQSKKRISAY